VIVLVFGIVFGLACVVSVLTYCSADARTIRDAGLREYHARMRGPDVILDDRGARAAGRPRPARTVARGRAVARARKLGIADLEIAIARISDSEKRDLTHSVRSSGTVSVHTSVNARLR